MFSAPVALNAQVMINCKAGGDCNGGNPGGVYEYAFEEGIPDSSCEQYTATNLDHRCTPIDICRDCTSPPPDVGQSGIDHCWAVDYKKYYVSNYYNVRGANRMKAEIYKNGPISCGMDVTDNFEYHYDGHSIYSEHVTFPMINHEVSIIGWGYDEDSKTEYWIGRNSWGTYWGDYGFFKIKMHSDNLGIETDCSAGIPTTKRPMLVDDI